MSKRLNKIPRNRNTPLATSTLLRGLALAQSGTHPPSLPRTLYVVEQSLFTLMMAPLPKAGLSKPVAEGQPPVLPIYFPRSTPQPMRRHHYKEQTEIK